MNNKIMLFIEIPTIEQELNILVPMNKKIGNIKRILVKYINNQIVSEELLNNNCSFFDKDTGKIISNNVFVGNSNLYNGQTLILI